MKEIERRISGILSEYDDIAPEILQLCNDFSTDEMFSLNPQLQNELKDRLSTNKMEEDVWDSLLSILPPNELSEDVINYLVQNQIALSRLCHMQLQDKWLMKLISYDEAPLYTLARRYYLLDEYSPMVFLQFYNQYLRNKNDVCLHLLDIYKNADKQGLLIFLCSKNENFENKEMLQWYQVANQVRGFTNSTDIETIYKEYQNVGIILTEIASNYYTSEEILLELLSAKGIKYASSIRKKSEENLKLRRIIGQKVQ